MRDIKFRAWDVKYKEMRYINDLYFFEEEGIHEIVDGVGKGGYVECEIMQYIGFKDKNGKDVYEGDVITDKFGELFAVVYDEQFASYRLDSLKDNTHVEYLAKWFMDDEDRYNLEVVGNIYEEE